MQTNNYQTPRMREIEIAAKRGICQNVSPVSDGLDKFGGDELSDDFAQSN